VRILTRASTVPAGSLAVRAKTVMVKKGGGKVELKTVQEESLIATT
jgi:hypothetical protein